METVTMDKLLTLEEAAELMRQPVNTLRFWRHIGGKGPKSAKLGARIFYREADVLGWIDAQFVEDKRPGA